MKTIMIVFALMLVVIQPAAANEFCELGLFFDEAATTRNIAASPGTTVHAYLILLTDGDPIQLTDFNQYTLIVPNFTDCWTEIRGGGINTHVPWSGEDLGLEIHWDIPYLVDGSAVLADLYIPITDENTIMFLAECYTFGNIVGETSTVDWSHCTYCDMMPPSLTIAATVNGDHEPVGSEGDSWSSIKRFYR